MNQPSEEAFPRLVERRAGGDSAEDRAAAMIRGALVPRDPLPSELARISRAVASSTTPRGHVRVAFRLALVVVCMIAGGATVKAYELVRDAGWLGGAPPSTTPVPKPATARAAKRAATPAPVAPMAPPAPDDSRGSVGMEAKAPEGPRLAPGSTLAMNDGMTGEGTRPARSATPRVRPEPQHVAAALEAQPALEPAPAPFVAPPVSHAGSTSPRIAEETRAIDRAIAYLRRDRDAGAALAALDRYLDRYPNGALRREAHLARIDALLVLGRTDEVLHALEATSFDRGLRSTELLVVRAELRAERDCRRAEQDFTVALGRSADTSLLERILYGRGACRAKLQDNVGAATDLRRYLEHFPTGAHAPWARRWVASAPTSERGR